MSIEKKDQRRLWVISELYFPEETSTGYYLTRIAEGLASDFDVKVISGQPNYSARGTTAPKHEVRNGVEIFRVAGTRLDKNVIVFRIINMITLSFSVFISAIRRFQQGDRVLVVTNPPAVPFIVALAAQMRGSVYSLLIHDNYPEILIAAGKVGERSLVARSVAFFNRWLHKHASQIIVVGRDMLELMRRKTAGLDVPISVVPNWAELETVFPAPRSHNSLLEELEIADKFVILYAGNMGPPNEMEAIIQAADILRDREEIHWVFLGTGAKRPWLMNEIGVRGLRTVTVLDPRPRSEQSVFLNACDIALVSLVNGMLGVSMPSRTYNILAAGKPILAIAEAGSEIALIVEEENVGWVVPPAAPEELAEAVVNAQARAIELPDMGRRARSAAESKYSVELAIEGYRSILVD